MEDKYIFYDVDGERFKIRESEMSEFEKDFPTARVNMSVGGENFPIAINERDEFLKDFGDGASYTNFDDARGSDDRPSWGESAVKGAGAGFTRTGKGLLDALTVLSSNNTYVDPLSANPIQMLRTGQAPKLVKTPDYDTLMREKEDPMIKASLKMGEVADRLSKEADPTHGEKGFVDLISEGKIGLALQKGLATGVESLPMTLSAYSPYTMALNMVSMAGSNYAEQTTDNPEVDKWKRAVQAVGSAALEQAVEKFSDPIFKYIGGGKAAGEFTEDVAKEVLENGTKEATEGIAKRILNVLKNTGKDAVGEGAEEVITSFGNDALGEALDLIDGDKDYGIRAQWEQMKEEDPDADLGDFALGKAKEYMDSFIGGALSGTYMSGTTQAFTEGAEYASDRRSRKAMDASYNLGASMDYGDMYDTDEDVASSIENATGSFTDDNGTSVLSRSFVENLSAEEAFTLSRQDNLPIEQRRALGMLALNKAKQEGLNKKLDEILENRIVEARSRVTDASDGGQVVSGMYNGRVVYVKGGEMKNGTVSPRNGVANGPVVIIDTVTGEKTTVNSNEIISASVLDAETLGNDIENYFRENEYKNREAARNTMSFRAKMKAIQPYAGKKILVDIGNGTTEVFVQQISPKGEVIIKGKKGDLGGQAILTLNADTFYDSIYRDGDGNPVVTEAGTQEEAPEAEVHQEPVEPTGEADFRDFAGTIIINGKPIQVDEITAQDNVSDSITYRYTDENGVQRTGNTTIGAFAEAVNLGRQQAETPAPEPTIETPEPMPAEPVVPVEPSPMPEPQPAPAENIELEPEGINWDALFEQDKEAFFSELQNQFGDETLDILNEFVSAAQEELDLLNKKKKSSNPNDILATRKQKIALQNRIDAYNQMIARLSDAPVVETPEAPVGETPVSEVPSAPEVPVETAPAPTPAPVPDTPPATPEPSPAPIAPNPVANPVDEAKKKERQLITNLAKIGLAPEAKQDLAYNAGKAVADLFATREEYDSYAETATDFGAYNADFERGVEDSFAARNQQNTSNPPVNSVPLENQPNGENNGEQQPTSNEPTTEGRGSDTTGGGTNDGGNQEGGEGTQKTKSPRRSKGKKSGQQVEDKYPARKGNATQKLLVDTFGFESVTIPNARKEILNTIYDFMMEMSKTLGISPKSIGQGGWLSIGNMRSNKNAIAAHQIKSNTLTRDISEVSLRFKYARLSSIAHEWWHSLDRALGYFNTGKLEDPTSEVRETSFTGREEVWEAVKGVVDAINNSGYTARIEQLVKRQTRAVREYFLRNTEQSARAFDEYITNRFAEAGITIDNYDNQRDDTQPTAEEMKVISPAIDNLFKVLKEKEGKKQGTSVLYHISEEMEPQSDSKKFATEGILTALDDGNREVVIMEDEQTKQYLKAIGADTDTQFSIDTDKPIFLSNAAIAVMGIKQEKATPEQWLKMIEKAGGLKAGEDKWMGLSDWLKAQDAKTLTKQEVLDFINENTIRIEEVGYKQWDALDYIDEAVKILEAEMREVGWDAMVEKYPHFDELFEEYNGELMWSETRAPVAEYEQFIFDEHNLLERPINDTRENYTTDGLDNKREIAIIVPTIEPWSKSDVIHFGDAGDGRAIAWVRFGDARTYAKEFADFYDFQGKMQKKYFPDRVIQALGGSDLDALTEEERAEFERLREIASSIPAKDRINRRILVIDEIQSKRHQEGREKGYKSDFDFTEKEKDAIARLDSMYVRRAELVREKENNTEDELTRIAQIEIELDSVRNVRDYDRLTAERDAIIEKRKQRDDEINELRREIYRAEDELASLNVRYSYDYSVGIPDAPFEKNWSELAMKRMLRYAAENGYDAVAWTKGEQQAERYNIGGVLEAIQHYESEKGRVVIVKPRNNESSRFVVNNEGLIIEGRGPLSGDATTLSDVVGKELASKIMSGEGEDIEKRDGATYYPAKMIKGEGVRIGGEGMKGFYDKMLPAFMNKYGKKWGVKVSDITLPHVEQSGRVMHSVPVNDAMKESVMEGQPMFYKTPNGIVYGWTDGKKIYLTKAGLNPNTPIHEYTHLWAKAMMLRNPKGWESIKKLLKGTPVWNEVMNDANYSNIHSNEDLVASEALSRISGSENAAKMEKMAQQMIDEAKGTGRKLEVRGLIQNMRDALNKFWNWVGTNLFGIENFKSVEQVTDRVLFDLLNKTDLDNFENNSLSSQSYGNTEDAYTTNDGRGTQPETEGVQGEVSLSGPLGEERRLYDPEGREVSQDAYARFNPIHEREGESDNRRNLREARFFSSFEKLTSDEQLLLYNFLNKYLPKNSGVLRSRANSFVEELRSNGGTALADFVEDFINDELKYREGISSATAAKHGLLVGISYDASRLEQIFDAYNNDKYNEALFDRAIKLAKRFGVSIKFATRNKDGSFFSAFGSYNPNDNTITLDANLLVDGNTAELCQTIVHELIHSVVARAASIMSGRAVDNNKQLIDPQSLPKDVIDGINALKEVYDAIKDDGTFQDTYGKKDFEEMLSEITDSKFRGLLKAKKLWKKFLNGICRILGIADESSSESDALTEIESALDKILSSAERGELDSAYASYLGQLAEGYTLDDLQRLESGPVKAMLTQNKLFKTGIDPTEVATQTASLVYDQVVSDSWQEFQRQFQDAMQPVRIAIDAIQQETGNIPIEDYENYILIQNQSSSRSRVEIDDFARRYYSPIIEQVNKIIDTILESRGYDKNDRVKRSEVYKEVKTYLIAKHGLERNKYYQSIKTRLMKAHEMKPELDQAKQDYDDKVNQINADATLSDAERQLQLRDALDEYNATIQEIRTREVPDIRDYSGLTTLFATEDLDEAEQRAQEAVDNFENAVATDELWAKINAATDKTLRHSYESGLLSRQQYNDIKDMFEFYIPLRGFDESTAEDVYAYARFEGNRFNPAVHKAKGRTSLADDPIAIIMNMAESEIAQGNKNRAKQALYNFLLNRPVTDADGNQHQNSLMQIESVWYIKTTDTHGNETYQLATPDRSIGETYEEFENRMMADPDAIKSKKGQVDVGMRFQKQSHKDAHYVYLKVNGVEKAIYINGNPKAADAINGTYAPLPNEAMQKVKDVQRLVSSTFTNYSLEFTARNYFRDMVYSHINIGVRESDPAYRKKFRQNWRHNNMGTMLKMLKAYRAGEYDGRPLNEDEAAFVDFMNNGGQTGYTLINSVEAHKKELERAIERMQKGIVKGGVKDTTIFRYTLGGIELLNEASELVTRFAAFKTSRDMGRGINRSINDAKEVTVNFNTKGAQDGSGWMGVVARYWGAVKYFFNASVQGVQNLGAAFQKNKLKFGTVVGSTIGLGMLMPILQGALSELMGGDEDEYWNIPEYDRQNNLCIVIGKGKYVKLPLPIGFREMYGLGDLMMGGILDKKFTRSPLSVGMDVANKIATIVLPINPLEGSANGLSLIESAQDMLLPDFTQGMVQNRTNTDFKGVPIQKEYTYNENDPQWTKAFANNPAWLTGLSKWCYENIAVDGEGWDWSPEKLDNTFSNAFGGIYSLLKKTGRTVSAIWNEDNRTLSNVPLVGVIVGSNIDDDQRFVNSTYWEMDEYYNKRLYKIESTAKDFGLTLDDVFARNPEGERAGEHQPAMNKIYNSDYFDFMQEWYLGHKGEGEVDENGNKILGLSQIKNKIKNLETKIKKNEDGVATPEQDEELVELNNLYEATRRDLVNDLLELD